MKPWLTSTGYQGEICLYHRLDHSTDLYGSAYIYMGCRGNSNNTSGFGHRRFQPVYKVHTGQLCFVHNIFSILISYIFYKHRTYVFDKLAKEGRARDYPKEYDYGLNEGKGGVIDLCCRF